MRARTGRLLRAAAALTLAVAAMPLAAGTGAASQGGGDEHKVTLCHRTNSENNPYVVITVDKASVFKHGHDGHDEGGVYQPGDKARGVRWGDIIPAFDYFASPQDEKAGTVSQYPGLNYGTDGQAVLNNGCQVPGPPPPVEQPHPSGSLNGSCPDDDGDFVVTGSTNDDDGTGVQFRLNVGGASFIDVPSDGSFEKPIDAAQGTVVTLEYRIGSGAWTSTGETVTVTDCPPTTQPVAPTGTFTVKCTASGAIVDIGTLDRGSQNGGQFQLVVNGAGQRVTSNQKDIAVPGGATLVLRYVAPGGATTMLDSKTGPAACPPPPVVTPASGSLTVECTTSGASVDLGALSQGSASGGTFLLVVNGTPQTVTSGQQDIAVPGSASLVLQYVPASGTPTVLQSATAPAACATPPVTPPPPTTPQPERGLNLVKAVSPTGAASVGATLTYTLVVTTTGNAAQTGVTVSDYQPGYPPGSTSGTTTYVAGSAGCTGSGTCTTSYDATTHRVSWGLGTMPAGTSRAVSFQVTIDAPTTAADGGFEAFDVVNVGVVSSEQVPATPSNEVVTPVAAVLGTKTGQPPTTSGGSTPNSPTEIGGGLLPHTGGASLVGTLGLAGLLLLLGGGLVSLPAVRRRN